VTIIATLLYTSKYSRS